MTARSFTQGHEIIRQDDEWVYADTGESIGIPRACKFCKCFPTPEGHDACLGHIPGAVHACCGHGVEPGWVIHEDGSCDVIAVRSKEEHQKLVDWEKDIYGYSWHEQFGRT